jgi:hypothetical protein
MAQNFIFVNIKSDASSNQTPRRAGLQASLVKLLPT